MFSLEQPEVLIVFMQGCVGGFTLFRTRINDIAIAMSYSSRADPGLRVAFKCLNV